MQALAVPSIQGCTAAGQGDCRWSAVGIRLTAVLLETLFSSRQSTLLIQFMLPVG